MFICAYCFLGLELGCSFVPIFHFLGLELGCVHLYFPFSYHFHFLGLELGCVHLCLFSIFSV